MFKQQQRQGKIKSLTGNRGIPTQKKEIWTQYEMSGVPQRGNRELCCVDIQSRKETDLHLPPTVQVCAAPSQLRGTMGTVMPSGRSDSGMTCKHGQSKQCADGQGVGMPGRSKLRAFRCRLHQGHLHDLNVWLLSQQPSVLEREWPQSEEVVKPRVSSRIPQMPI